VLCPGEPVPLGNPLASTQGVMRRSLLPGMLSAAQANINQGERKLVSFEQGRVFALGDDALREHERLGVVLRDEIGDSEARFRRLKGVVESICEKVGLPALEWMRGGQPWFDDGAGAVLQTADGKPVGMAGLVSRDVGARWDLGPDVAAAEIDMNFASEPAVTRFEVLARFPSVVMDMTVEHGMDLDYAELEAATRDLVGEWVEDLSYVTQFKPEGEPQVVRTTLRLVYRHPERSLTQEEVNAAQDELRQGLADALGVGFA
jgi:phenylalanyl-tRNA synthetase beta chain